MHFDFLFLSLYGFRSWRVQLNGGTLINWILAATIVLLAVVIVLFAVLFVLSRDKSKRKRFCWYAL